MRCDRAVVTVATSGTTYIHSTRRQTIRARATFPLGWVSYGYGSCHLVPGSASCVVWRVHACILQANRVSCVIVRCVSPVLCLFTYAKIDPDRVLSLRVDRARARRTNVCVCVSVCTLLYHTILTLVHLYIHMRFLCVRHPSARNIKYTHTQTQTVGRVAGVVRTRITYSVLPRMRKATNMLNMFRGAHERERACA